MTLNLTTLTRAELKIAQLAAKGLSMREIGLQTGWTPAAIKVYLSQRVYKKIGVTSQVALIRWWVDHVEQRGECDKCLLRQAQLVVIETPSEKS